MGSGLCKSSSVVEASRAPTPTDQRTNTNVNRDTSEQVTGNRETTAPRVQQSPRSPGNSQQSRPPIDLALPIVNPNTVVTESPRPEMDHEINIPYTPTGVEAELFKYYCPLCMLYFKTILKTKCCGNYMCFVCTRDYVHTKGLDYVNRLEHLEDNVLLEEIPCPHCFTQGFFPVVVKKTDTIRDYSMHDQPKSHYAAQPSPLRVGESFEDMKRKMIPFKALAAIPSSSSMSPEPSQHQPQHNNNNNNNTAVGGIAMIDNSPVPSISDRNHPNHTNNNSLSMSTPRPYVTPRDDNDNEEDDEHINRLLPHFTTSTSSALNTPNHHNNSSNKHMIDPDIYPPNDNDDDNLSESYDEASCSLFHHLNASTSSPYYRHELAEHVVKTVLDHALHHHHHSHHHPLHLHQQQVMLLS